MKVMTATNPNVIFDIIIEKNEDMQSQTFSDENDRLANYIKLRKIEKVNLLVFTYFKDDANKIFEARLKVILCTSAGERHLRRLKAKNYFVDEGKLILAKAQLCHINLDEMNTFVFDKIF